MIKDTQANKIDSTYDSDLNPEIMAIYFGSNNDLVKQGIYPERGFQNYKPTIDSKRVLSFQLNNSDKSESNKKNTDSETYKFQLRDVYNNKQFVLIGYDKYEKTCLKDKTSVNEVSVNFLSNKAIHNKDGKKTSYHFNLSQPYTLNSDVVYGFGSDALEKIKKWQY